MIRSAVWFCSHCDPRRHRSSVGGTGRPYALIDLIRGWPASLLGSFPCFPKHNVQSPTNFPCGPRRIQGRTLKPLPLKDYEQRFTEGLPGRLAKFTDGTCEYMLQWIADRTRLLLLPRPTVWPALGFKITPEPLWIDEAGNRLVFFSGHAADQLYRVRSRIFNSDGQSWHDPSSWYWSVLVQHVVGAMVGRHDCRAAQMPEEE